MKPRLLLFALLAILPGCTFGMDYSGDETGLRRDSVPIDGHPERELSYLIDDQPDEPRVIFIHGSPGQSNMYVDYLRDPVPGFETIAIDRMGYGESTPHAAVTSLSEHAASIEPLLVQRKGLWPILVGHSLGGPIATQLAAEYPDRVGGLVIVGTGLNPEFEDVRWYNKVARWRIINPFLAGFLRISNEEMYACKGEIEQLVPLLDRIECPIVIIHGTGDDLVPFETVKFSVQEFAGNDQVYVIVLIGEGHSVTKLRKEEIRETLSELRSGLLDPLEQTR